MTREEQEKLADLHDHLHLHEMNLSKTRCTSCGIRMFGTSRIDFEPCELIEKLIPDVRWKVKFGDLSAADELMMKRLLGETQPSSYDWSYGVYQYFRLDASGVMNIAQLERFVPYYDMLNAYLIAHPELPLPTSKPLTEFPILRQRLAARLDAMGKISCDAYTPKRLGWNRMGHTDDNITSGNKAVVYQHADGRIAIYHSQHLTLLGRWKQRCKSLTKLLIKLFGTKVLLAQTTGMYYDFCERYTATGVFVE